jgi:hypothetical protein
MSKYNCYKLNRIGARTHDPSHSNHYTMDMIDKLERQNNTNSIVFVCKSHYIDYMIKEINIINSLINLYTP